MKCDLVLILLAIAATPVTANEVFTIGDNGPLGTGTNHLIHSVSGNGSVIPVIQSGGAEALVWTPDNGLVSLSSISGSSFAANSMFVSDDGQVIAGQTYGDDKAYRWTADTGLEIIGLPDNVEYSGASGMSADGSVLAVADVGRLTDNPPFLWTRERGFESLELPAGYQTARPGQVSADGSSIIGSLYQESADAWEIEAFRWDDVNGVEPIGTLPNWGSSIATDLSADGSVVVGYLCNTGGQAHCGSQPASGFRWTRDEGMVQLSSLTPEHGNQALVVSRDGSLVLGRTLSQSGSADRQHAFIWDQTNGMRKLEDVLSKEYGVELPDVLPLLTAVWDVSADSRVLVGNSSTGGGFGIQWAIYLNRPLVASSGIDGDFNGSTEFDSEDLDLLAQEIRSGRNVALFDVDSDSVVNDQDRGYWVRELANTYFGDSNLDGEFNTSDLVQVFEAGQYEDGTNLNSTWTTGDWNGDGDFTTSDLVLAFEGGGYEQGPRNVLAVPEPSSAVLLLAPLISFVRRKHQRERWDNA